MKSFHVYIHEFKTFKYDTNNDLYKDWSKSNVTQFTALLMGFILYEKIYQNLPNQNFNSNSLLRIRLLSSNFTPRIKK